MTAFVAITDVLDADDFRRAQLRDTSPCPNCHAEDPARLGRFRGVDGCSECLDFPRCLLCRRWVGDGFALVERSVSLADGSIGSLCVLCYPKVIDDPDGSR